jgi:hypothetical protein
MVTPLTEVKQVLKENRIGRDEDGSVGIVQGLLRKRLVKLGRQEHKARRRDKERTPPRVKVTVMSITIRQVPTREMKAELLLAGSACGNEYASASFQYEKIRETELSRRKVMMFLVSTSMNM